MKTDHRVTYEMANMNKDKILGLINLRKECTDKISSKLENPTCINPTKSLLILIECTYCSQSQNRN